MYIFIWYTITVAAHLIGGFTDSCVQPVTENISERTDEALPHLSESLLVCDPIGGV